LPPDHTADVRALERVCVVGGQESMPYPTQVKLDPRGERMTLLRHADESGSVLVPWEVPGAGRLMCSTATLIEREAPYRLQMEVARGKVNQLRCQASDWLMGGLQMSAALEQHIHEATLAFTRAVAALPSAESDPHALTALTQGHAAADQLVQAYVN